MQTENTKPEDLLQKIASLETHRCAVDFDYKNSPWSSGPRYRTKLAKIDSELVELRAQLPAAT